MKRIFKKANVFILTAVLAATMFPQSVAFAATPVDPADNLSKIDDVYQAPILPLAIPEIADDGALSPKKLVNTSALPSSYNTNPTRTTEKNIPASNANVIKLRELYFYESSSINAS